MKNLIRNVWVCLGLMVLPFTASGQQKDNITYVPAQGKHLHSAILSFIPRLFIFVKEVKDGSFCILHPLSP